MNGSIICLLIHTTHGRTSQWKYLDEEATRTELTPQDSGHTIKKIKLSGFFWLL